MIDRFEKWAREVVEGSFRRLFQTSLTADDLINRLYLAMEDSLVGVLIADSYQIYLHPDDYEAIGKEILIPRLSGVALRFAQEMGWQLPFAPKILITPNESVGVGQIRIVSGFRNLADGEQPSTAVYNQPAQSTPQTDLLGRGAYLVVNGRQTVLLTKPLNTIGRRSDNDVILAEPTISRLHAHIRWQDGHFILQDVTGRGRTRVNDVVVTQHVLQNGDVIRIHDASLIYGEEHPTHPNEAHGQTQILPRPE